MNKTKRLRKNSTSYFDRNYDCAETLHIRLRFWHSPPPMPPGATKSRATAKISTKSANHNYNQSFDDIKKAYSCRKVCKKKIPYQKCTKIEKPRTEGNWHKAFSLTWPAARQIKENKRKLLHCKKVKHPRNWFGTPTWPPFHCFETPTWRTWRHLKTLYTNHRNNWTFIKWKTERQGHTKTKLKMLKEIRKIMTLIFKTCLEPQMGKFPAMPPFLRIPRKRLSN